MTVFGENLKKVADKCSALLGKHVINFVTFQLNLLWEFLFLYSRINCRGNETTCFTLLLNIYFLIVAGMILFMGSLRSSCHFTFIFVRGKAFFSNLM